MSEKLRKEGRQTRLRRFLETDFPKEMSLGADVRRRARPLVECVVQIAFIAVFFRLIEQTVAYAKVQIPANVIAAAVLIGLLFAGVVELRWVERGADFLLRHLVLLYVPITLTLINERGRSGRELALLAFAVIVSAVVTIVVTGWTAQRLSQMKSSPDEPPA